MIITIDGPAGAGKSTAARGLAKRLGFEFLDTGAMYRAVAWACLSEGVDLHDPDSVTPVAARVELSIDGDSISCNGTDVTAAIRTAEAGQAASFVAAVSGVRHEMVRLQRETAHGRNIVTEGRDQGSVVFPDAECRFYLTADASRRAERRVQELAGRGETVTLEEILAQIVDRDERDRNREVGPLVKPADSIEVDTAPFTATEVIDRLEVLARERLQLSGQPQA